MVPGWQEIKQFSDRYYPDIEIISINPVGLKGLFKEEYKKRKYHKKYKLKTFISFLML